MLLEELFWAFCTNSPSNSTSWSPASYGSSATGHLPFLFDISIISTIPIPWTYWFIVKHRLSYVCWPFSHKRTKYFWTHYLSWCADDNKSWWTTSEYPECEPLFPKYLCRLLPPGKKVLHTKHHHTLLNFCLFIDPQGPPRALVTYGRIAEFGPKQSKVLSHWFSMGQIPSVLLTKTEQTVAALSF